MNITIRELTISEYPLLEDFLYHAIFIPPGDEQPPREIIFEPEIYIYADCFGNKQGDYAIAAEVNDTVVGIAWTRIIPAYGHLDDNTPELAISVLPEYRGQGIGAMMMTRLFALLQEKGYQKTSLSVQKNNPAVRFYQRLGYQTTGEREDFAGHEDYLMVKEL